MKETFLMSLEEIQPSQLFISLEKLSRVMEGFDPLNLESLDPIPVKKLGEDVIFTDGHTRAFAAFSCGFSEVKVFWDEDEMDWEAYEVCVRWCKEEGIYTIEYLKGRVVTPEEYETLWLKRCGEMHKELELRRKPSKVL